MNTQPIFFVQFGPWLVASKWRFLPPVQRGKELSEPGGNFFLLLFFSAWEGTTEPAPRINNASRQRGNLPQSGQLWAGFAGGKLSLIFP